MWYHCRCWGGMLSHYGGRRQRLSTGIPHSLYDHRCRLLAASIAILFDCFTRVLKMLEALSPDDEHRLDQFMEAATRQLQDVDDIKVALRDAAKALGEELGVNPKPLMAAAKT